MKTLAFTIGIALIASRSTFADLKVQVSFADRSIEPVSVISETNPLVLLSVEEMNPQDRLTANIQIKPFGSKDRSKRIDLDDWDLTPSARGKGRFSWEFHLPTDAFEYDSPLVWEVNAAWTTTSGQHGVAREVALLMRSKARNFFRIKERTDCTFPGPLKATSSWIENVSGYLQLISLSDAQNWNTLLSSGVQMGHFLPLDNSDLRTYANASHYGPFFGVQGQTGWFFEGWSRTLQQMPSEPLVRHWQLPPGLGGVIAERWIYSRYQAEEWRANRDLWTTGTQGTLVVGVKEVGFFVVPKELTANGFDLEKVNIALNDAYNGVSYCGESLEALQSFDHFRKVSDDHSGSPLYFRPLLY